MVSFRRTDSAAVFPFIFIGTYTLFMFRHTLLPFRILIFLFSCAALSPGDACAQHDSLKVVWKITLEKDNGNEYLLKISGTLASGWHLYARSDASAGVEGLVLQPRDSGVVAAPLGIQTPGIVIADPVFDGQKMEVVKDSFVATSLLRFNTTLPAVLRINLSYFVASKDELIPEEQKLTLPLSGGVAKESARMLIERIDLKKPVNDCRTDSAMPSAADKSLLSLFLLGFVGGLIALITPCVFPMIPLTVSFFTRKSISRRKGVYNAFWYGFFILAIYVLLSIPFHFLDRLNPEILNNISTNVYLNVAFFLIFIFFAFSFFGFYEITLPGSISSAADSKSGTGNIAGIFFMALTLALVSFSCTGPILGSLLAGSLTTDGGAMQLTAGMAGFGLALALPFALFALFPNLLKSLPKSGGWLNTVKVVLGFAELAMAFKFLSNADLVRHWGLLKREIFIGIWVVLGALTTLYLLGLIRFPHDDKPAMKPGWLRRFFAMSFAAFTLYLIPGLTNTPYANLKLISGFPPPLYYSIYAGQSQCLLNLNCAGSYEEGLAMARASGKPMLLDFTGYACVNCRRMEENVWSRPEVLGLMKDKFIVVSLYVDDKKALPAAEQFTYKTAEGIEKEIVTVGDKWATFETENFENNAQPLYAIVSPDERLLNHPVGYTPDAAAYKAWLQCALAAMGRR